jgi:hypothetical protein
VVEIVVVIGARRTDQGEERNRRKQEEMNEELGIDREGTTGGGRVRGGAGSMKGRLARGRFS